MQGVTEAWMLRCCSVAENDKKWYSKHLFLDLPDFQYSICFKDVYWAIIGKMMIMALSIKLIYILDVLAVLIVVYKRIKIYILIWKFGKKRIRNLAKVLLITQIAQTLTPHLHAPGALINFLFCIIIELTKYVVIYDRYTSFFRSWHNMLCNVDSIYFWFIESAWEPDFMVDLRYCLELPSEDSVDVDQPGDKSAAVVNRGQPLDDSQTAGNYDGTQSKVPIEQNRVSFS